MFSYIKTEFPEFEFVSIAPCLTGQEEAGSAVFVPSPHWIFRPTLIRPPEPFLLQAVQPQPSQTPLYNHCSPPLLNSCLSGIGNPELDTVTWGMVRDVSPVLSTGGESPPSTLATLFLMQLGKRMGSCSYV